MITDAKTFYGKFEQLIIGSQPLCGDGCQNCILGIEDPKADGPACVNDGYLCLELELLHLLYKCNGWVEKHG